MERRNSKLCENKKNLANSIKRKRPESDLKQLEKQINKAKERVEKLLKELNKSNFNSPEEARYKLKGINKKLKILEIKEINLSAKKTQKIVRLFIK